MGEDADLVEGADPAALHLALESDPAPHQSATVPAEATVLVQWSSAGERAVVRDHVRRVARSLAVTGSPPVGRHIRIPVHYDGADLADLARLLAIGVPDLIRRHSEALWTVAFLGFAPGFGYLTSRDWTSPVPRRASPRTSVPVGAVAVAGHYAGVYPRSSPGGWQLLGRTDTPLWDLGRTNPALLAVGDTVTFEMLG